MSKRKPKNVGRSIRERLTSEVANKNLQLAGAEMQGYGQWAIGDG